MMKPKDDNPFQQLVLRMAPDNKLLRTWKLKGGVSAQVTALEMMQPDGHTQKVVVRQHSEADRNRNPTVAADEFRLLQCLHAAGFPVPSPYHLDSSGEIFPTPVIVVQWIEGRVEFAPSHLPAFLIELATHLADIHRVNAHPDFTFLPRQEKIVFEKLEKHPETLNESWEEGRIRHALESVWPLSQQNPSVLLHGDFWPGNVLWKDHRLIGIIDWEDAAYGDPLADLANARLEVLWAFGVEAMNFFTDHYRSIMTTLDFGNLPDWDLWAALRPVSSVSTWGLDANTEKTMRKRHQRFVNQAMERASRN